MTRQGSVDGMAKQKAAVTDSRKWRLIEAHRIVEIMEKEDLLEPADPDEITDHQAAKESLTLCVSIVRGSTYQTRERLEAARTVLNFTKAKPVQKQEHIIKSAESWLDAIADKVEMPTE